MPKRNKQLDVFLHIDMSGGADACWPWTKDLHNGRPYFSVGGRKRLVYRIIYEMKHGVELQTKELIRHTCDQPKCCNPAHMLVGSHKENMGDMVDRDRHGLSRHVVRAIYSLAKEGRTHQEIADLYGISREAVVKIANRKRHANDTEDLVDDS